MKSKFFLVPVFLYFVSACGGGGGGGGGGGVPPVTVPPPPLVQSGQFKDANTQGLSFSTPSQAGTTDALGTFSYQSGETVQFSVGGVVIGSAPGQPVVTPLDLAASASASDTEVTNIVRFLLMLDENEDASDGIQISAAVQNIAANWSQVDFTSGSFGNDLATIISDVASVDSRVAALPGNPAAREHLSGSIYCLASGVFTGTRTMSGNLLGNVYFILNPANGIMRATYRGNTEEFSSTTALVIDEQRAFNLTKSGNGDNIEGRFDSYDDLSGVWSIGGQSGEFTATRLGGDLAATYRFVVDWATGNSLPPLTNGIMTFDIAADDEITGSLFRVDTGEIDTLRGTASGSDVEFVTGKNSTFTGSFDESLVISSTFRTNNAGPGVWAAQGCKLN